MRFSGMRHLLVLAASLAIAATPALATSPRIPDHLERRAALEVEILRELNRVRVERGLRPLRRADGLRAAAVAHSRTMLQFGFFGHASPDGTTFDDRIRRHYPDRGWQSWSVAETLLADHPEVSAREIVAAWLGSLPHRDIILSATWREAGIGALSASFAPRTFGGTATVAVTADFGQRWRRDGGSGAQR